VTLFGSSAPLRCPGSTRTEPGRRSGSTLFGSERARHRERRTERERAPVRPHRTDRYRRAADPMGR
jgi:hypothetical protein